MCYASQVSGEKPASGAAIGNTQFSRSAKHTYTYSESQKGLPVYYSVCYENAKGEKGPWSPVEETFIG